MDFEKQHLTDYRVREAVVFLGFFISDNSLVFEKNYFSFSPKKREIKEIKYRIRYKYFDAGWLYQFYWGGWEERWKFKR